MRKAYMQKYVQKAATAVINSGPRRLICPAEPASCEVGGLGRYGFELDPDSDKRFASKIDRPFCSAVTSSAAPRSAGSRFGWAKRRGQWWDDAYRHTGFCEPTRISFVFGPCTAGQAETAFGGDRWLLDASYTCDGSGPAGQRFGSCRPQNAGSKESFSGNA